MTYEPSDMYYQDGNPELVFRPISTSLEWRTVCPPITINGQKVTRYKAPVITEYVDLQTGEIVPASHLKNNPAVWPTLHLGESVLRRQAVLDSLRSEVRSLASFILLFRNHRRGVTPDVDTLVEWYARLHNKRAANVRRNVKTLEKAGVLAGASLLSPLFQFSGKKAKAADHLGEDVAARGKYFKLSCRLAS
jgi:plasmid stabilization system protein ParE